jgi:hypothetical protein
VREVRRVVDVGRWWLLLAVGAAPLALLALAAVAVAVVSLCSQDTARRDHCLALVKALLGPLTPAARQGR